MKQTKLVSLERKARQANGLSHACERCSLWPCSTDIMRVCHQSFFEGYRKGYNQRKREEDDQ